ncbi:hypothetical protein D1BOALGB6SA_10007 [Olavius sp. associated proteobacterium Delta 1]|nr:hypothetical protein D1BOALGB6SA_10007 [Olavius sp. associated proteobacterium Delta 1]
MKKLTIFIAAIALVCFSVPAMAVDWNFYGSARMATFYVSDDLGDATTTGGDDGDTEIQWDLQGNSRLGANVKAENIKGQVELGLKGNGSGDVDVGTRRIYGVWDFGSGWMKVGKDYTPTSQFISGQVFDADLGLLGVGTNYANRVGQVAFGFGGFEVALISVDTRNVEAEFVLAGTTFNISDGDVDKYLPKIEAKWGMSYDAWNFGLMGGVNMFTVQDVVSSVDGDKNDIDVTSYILGGDAGFNFGPGYVKAAVSYGQNIGTAGWSLPGNRNQAAYAEWDGDDDIESVASFQGALVGGLKVSDMLSFEAGLGYRSDDPDSDYPLGDEKSNQMAVYVQSVIALAPGVYVIPEVGYFDGGKTYSDTDATTTFYLGGKWQINF